MPNSIDFYKRTFLHIIPCRISMIFITLKLGYIKNKLYKTLDY